ncbi:hypothetical protein B808_696 [Fructilactobacillus florum 8D]|uniref:IpaB/EvcA family protein n=1 Tax=Fructilactobacillus florum 8D TaxID=1221538 RepID=W9EL83_9LACO|nr:hypothetical protein [Fructilactobacillus florum]EKK20130.1 hypothetical protein B807_1136 [Fructilactobacillus florum 2F]ETO40424.1 hypothetical protein B808_696 [Fructilactobacillus florum 8D]
MADELQLNSTSQSLLNQVAHYFQGDVQVQFIGTFKSGTVRHDQAQVIQNGQQLLVQVSDLTAPDFVVTHELLHLLMTLRGFPKIYFPLTTDDHQLDNQLQYFGTELFDIILHLVVYPEQRRHGLITPEIEAAYVRGVRQLITPEIGKLDNEMIKRLVVIIDALVLLGPTLGDYRSVFEQNFPMATAAAQHLYQKITAKPTDEPFQVRRNAVKLFKAFDDQMRTWKLAELHLTDFAMITSVFSKRQLQLQVKQVFKLYHSELKDKESGTRAVVGFALADDQNSLVLAGPSTPSAGRQFIQENYEKTVSELFNELKLPYLLRS